MIREAKKEDLDELLELYLYLHEDSIPEHSEHLEKTWNQIIEDPNHHLIVNVWSMQSKSLRKKTAIK